MPVAYLDHAASAPMRPEATEAMLPWLAGGFANASGVHALSRRSRAAVEDAREIVAAAVGAQPSEVVFTGSGTEADNLAIGGVYDHTGGPIVCSAIEHHAVLHPCEARGALVVGVDDDGVIDLAELADKLSPSVTLVSVMLANNEVGTIQPLDDIAAVVRDKAPRAVLHTDAVQAFPWLDVAAAARGADLIALSAHKFGGPQGVGALIIRDGVQVAPQILGGGQERERRSGTYNVAGIVGMAAAASATAQSRAATVERVARLRDRLADGIVGADAGARETGDRRRKIAGNCHLHFDGIESEALLLLLDDAGICASAGSACASGALDPSHVLTAMGMARDAALSSVRLSLGATTTDDDVDLALKVLPDVVAQLRSSAS